LYERRHLAFYLPFRLFSVIFTFIDHLNSACGLEHAALYDATAHSCRLNRKIWRFSNICRHAFDASVIRHIQWYHTAWPGRYRRGVSKAPGEQTGSALRNDPILGA